MKKLKTITLSHGDTPSVSLCPGHVTAKVFNAAFKAEGWSGNSPFAKADLRHEYWKKLPAGGWKKSNAGDLKAVPVTVNDW